MAIKQTPVQEALRFLKDSPDALYLDVRTEAEFGRAHPAGAWNVPFFVSSGGGMSPNIDAFQKVVEALIPKDKPLVVGCQAGGRSQKACEALVAWGYTNLQNVAGGFGDWARSGLPNETGDGGDCAYPALCKKADR